MNSEDIELKIISLLDRIRPYLNSEGGNIEYVKYEDNIVYVRMIGACKECSMLDYTLKDGIEEMLISEIPEIKAVVNLD